MLSLLQDGSKFDPSSAGSPPIDWRVEIEKARLTSLVDPAGGSARFREIGLALPGRKARVQFARRALEFDDEARRWLTSGQAETRPDYAEFAYWSFLELYPFNAEVVLSYAQAILRQDKLVDAEVQFRQAVALGAAVEAVRPCLKTIALRQGEALAEPLVSKAAPGLKAPLNALSSAMGEAFLYPDLRTIRGMFRLFAADPPHLEMVAQLQRASRTAWDLLANILATEEFRRANLDLLYLLSDRARR